MFNSVLFWAQILSTCNQLCRNHVYGLCIQQCECFSDVIRALLCHAVPWDCLMPGWLMTSRGNPTVHLLSVLMSQIWVTPVNVCISSHQRSAAADNTREWTEKPLRLFEQPTDTHCREAQPRLKWKWYREKYLVSVDWYWFILKHTKYSRSKKLFWGINFSSHYILWMM